MPAPEPQRTWLKRARFRELCDQWLAENPRYGKEELGNLLELGGYNSLKQYYSGSKVPGRNLLIRMMAFFHVPSSDLIDDPHSPIGGIKADDLTEQGRLFFSLMFSKFKDEELTDEDREELYKDFTRSYDRIKSFRARLGKVPN